MKYLLGLLCTLCSYAVFSQQLISESITTNGITLTNMKENHYKVLDGSAYLSEKFEMGALLVSEKWMPAEIRYNSYTATLEYQKSGKIFELLPSQVQAFKLGGLLYKNGFKAIDKQSGATYYQLVYEGESTLLKYIYTELQEVINADDTKQGNKFVTYNKYYLIDSKKAFVGNFVLKKQLLKLLDNTKLPLVEKFIEKEGIKFKSDEDLIKILSYYDSIGK